MLEWNRSLIIQDDKTKKAKILLKIKTKLKTPPEHVFYVPITAF